MQCVALPWVVGSTRFPSAGSLQDEATPSSAASKKRQPGGKQAQQPDVVSTSIDKQVQSLPQGSQKQSTKPEEAQQPAGAPAQHAASTEPQPAAHTHEPVSNPASHPNTVDKIRCYTKSQVRWLLSSISPSFGSGNKHDDASLQLEQQKQQDERK